ncbi:MAG: hypothetical protein J6K39_01580 [Clostridia bacterium]|nr:hypothetical protein [Clostridia bacterium]
MKKKILTFLFAICLILPCAFIMTACNSGGDPPPPPAHNGSVLINGTNDYVIVTPADTEDYTNYTYESTDGNYAVWLADFYDKDTLEVCFDETPLTLTSCVDDSLYYDRTISLNIRKIATFSIPAEYNGEHNINVSVEEQELTVRFVTNDQEFTEGELDILDDYHITSMGGRTFKDMMLNDYRLYTTYSQIITSEAFYSDGIEFTGDKKLGYYVSHQIIKAVDPSLEIHNNYHKLTGNNYNYSFVINLVDTNNFAGFESTNILLTFDKENLKVSNFYFNGTNLDNEILSCKVNGVEIAEDKLLSSLLWKPTDDGDIKLYIEPYAGVDLTNVEVFVNDTEMTINEDSGKKYISIPEGALPIEYMEDDGNMVDFMFEAKTFVVSIKNVNVLPASNLYTSLTSTSNNSDITSGVYTVTYFISEDNDVTYYVPNEDIYAYYNIEGRNIRPIRLIVDGRTINLSENITRKNLAITTEIQEIEYGILSWKDENNYEYYHQVGMDDNYILMVVSFNADGTIRDFGVRYKSSGDSSVRLEF